MVSGLGPIREKIPTTELWATPPLNHIYTFQHGYAELLTRFLGNTIRSFKQQVSETSARSKCNSLVLSIIEPYNLHKTIRFFSHNIIKQDVLISSSFLAYSSKRVYFLEEGLAINTQ